jgi:rhodanese-related sulfurtransferase
MERLIFDLPKTVPDLLSKILFYCAKGRRAKGASAIAKTLGYNNTRYLVGTYTDL